MKLVLGHLKKLAYGLAALALLFGIVFAIGYARQNGTESAEPLPNPPTVRIERIEPAVYSFSEVFYGHIEPWARVQLGFERAGTTRWILPGPASRGGVPEGMKVAKGERLVMLDKSELLGELATRLAALDRSLAAIGLTDSQADALKADLALLRNPGTPGPADEPEEAALRGAEAALLNRAFTEAKAIEPSIREAEANLRQAQDELDRVSRLYDPDPAKSRASQTEMNRARTAKMSAAALLDVAKKQFDERAKDIPANLAQVQQTQARLSKMELASPIDGFLTDVATEVGQTVAPNTPVVELLDLSRVKAILGVMETHLPRLREGQQVRMAFDAHERALRLGELGVETDISPRGASADEIARLKQTWIGRIVRVPKDSEATDGRYLVEVELANRFVRRSGPDGEGLEHPLLRPGMFVRAEVLLDKTSVFKVPQSATVLDRSGPACFFLEPVTRVGIERAGLIDRRLELPLPSVRRVGLGAAVFVDGHYMLPRTPGGRASALVVVSGQHKLRDGLPVQVTNPQEAGQAGGVSHAGPTSADGEAR